MYVCMCGGRREQREDKFHWQKGNVTPVAHRVLPVAAHGGGGPEARVAAVRMGQRADGVRQLRRRRHVGGAHDAAREQLQSQWRCPEFVRRK